MYNIIGDNDGIELWNRLGSSKNKKEINYFLSLSRAASKFGKIWFSDITRQEFTRANQTIYQLAWNARNNEWNISLFHKSDGIPIPQKNEPIELDYDDIIIEEIK